MRTLILLPLALALAACATTKDIPPAAPEAVEVLVPVTKPCEIAQVANSPLPSAPGVPLDIFEAVKRVLADRQVLLGDREKLQAANSDPCPTIP